MSMFSVTRFWTVSVVLATLAVAGCAPLPKAQYWDGWFQHVDPPRYTFEVPEGWRPAAATDYPSLERAELEMPRDDTALISTRGAWIRVVSASGPGGWYTRRDFSFELSEREKQLLWERFSARLIQAVPPDERPTLTLESLGFEYYGQNRPLRLRFRADGPGGSVQWTVLEFHGSSGLVTLAHVGTPENPEEGISGFEVLAQSFRFE
jgi:hypothetical protein